MSMRFTTALVLVFVLGVVHGVNPSIVFSTTRSLFTGQLKNTCGGHYYIEVTDDVMKTVTFDPPVCRVYGNVASSPFCVPENEISGTNFFSATATSANFVYLFCTEAAEVLMTAIGDSGAQASITVHVYDLVSPVSDAPLVLYENACTPIRFALDRPLVDAATASSVLRFSWANAGPCSASSSNTCATAATTFTMVEDVASTYYDVYVTCGPSATVANLLLLTPKLTVSLQSTFGLDSATPHRKLDVFSIRDFSWSNNVPSLVQYQCSSALVAYASPSASRPWMVKLDKSHANCALFSDSYCSIPLPGDVLTVNGGSAAVFIQCSSVGSLVITSRVHSGSVVSSSMTITAPPSACTFDFASISLLESNPFPGAANDLTFTFRPVVSLAAGDTITINGLSSSSTASLSLSGPQADVFGVAGQWSQSASTLVLTVASGKSVTGLSDCSVTFTVTNPSVYSASKPFVTTSKAPSRVWPTAPLISSGRAGFSVKSISSSNRMPGDTTTLTITLRPNSPLVGPKTILIVQNLVSIDATSVSGSASSSFASLFSTGSLTLYLLFGARMPSDSDTVLTFSATNPTLQANPPVVTIAVDADSAENCDASGLFVSETKYFADNVCTLSELHPIPGVSNTLSLRVQNSVNSAASGSVFEVVFSPPLNLPSGIVTTVVTTTDTIVPISSQASYDSTTGVMTLTATRVVATSGVHTVTFSVDNSPSYNDGITAKIKHADTTRWANLAGTVGRSAAAFEILDVTEKSRVAGSSHALYFRLRPVRDVPFRSLEFASFYAASSASSASAPGFSLSYRSSLDQLRVGASTLTYLPGGEDTIIIFSVTYPSSAAGSTFPLTFQDVVFDNFAGTAYSTTTAPHGVLVSGVIETVTVPGLSNKVNFTIRPVTTQTSLSLVYIRGLVNSGTPSTASLPVSGVDIFGTEAGWDQTTGTITLTVASGKSLSSSGETVVEIELLNPSSAQPAISPQISLDNSNWVNMGGFVFGAAGGFTVLEYDVMLDPFLTDICMFAFIFAPRYTWRSGVVSFTGLAGSTASFAPTPTFSKAVLTTSGITGGYWVAGTGLFSVKLSTLLAKEESVTVKLERSFPFSVKSFSLEASVSDMGNLGPLVYTGSILLAIWQDTTSAADMSNQIAFYLRPSVSLSAGAIVRIRGFTNSGTSSASLSLTGIQAAIFGSSAQWDQSSGTLVLTIAGGQTVTNDADTFVSFSLQNPSAGQASFGSIEISLDGTLWVKATRYGFSVRTIEKVIAPAANRANYLVFQLRPLTTVRVGTSLTISGMDCVSISDTSVKLIGKPAVFPATGTWNPAGSSLEFTFTTNAMVSTQTYSLMIYFSAATSQTCNPTISIQSRAPASLLNIVPNLPGTSFGSSMATFGAAESSSKPGQVNTLTFTLRPVVGLVAGQTVVIDGLTNTKTPSSASLAISGADASIFGSSASWTQSTGLLVLTVAGGQTMSASQDSVVTVNLVNPAGGHVPVVPRVSIDYQTPIAADKGVLGEVLARDQVCTACSAQCELCSNPFTCFVCAPGFPLVSGSCSSDVLCDEGYANDGSVCSPCVANCKTCDPLTASSKCLVCKTPYLLSHDDSACVTTCTTNTRKVGNRCKATIEVTSPTDLKPGQTGTVTVTLATQAKSTLDIGIVKVAGAGWTASTASLSFPAGVTTRQFTVTAPPSGTASLVMTYVIWNAASPGYIVPRPTVVGARANSAMTVSETAPTTLQVQTQLNCTVSMSATIPASSDPNIASVQVVVDKDMLSDGLGSFPDGWATSLRIDVFNENGTQVEDAVFSDPLVVTFQTVNISSTPDAVYIRRMVVSSGRRLADDTVVWRDVGEDCVALGAQSKRTNDWQENSASFWICRAGVFSLFVGNPTTVAGSQLSAAAIAGIVISCLVVVVLTGLFVRRHKKRPSKMQKKSKATQPLEKPVPVPVLVELVASAAVPVLVELVAPAPVPVAPTCVSVSEVFVSLVGDAVDPVVFLPNDIVSMPEPADGSQLPVPVAPTCISVSEVFVSLVGDAVDAVDPVIFLPNDVVSMPEPADGSQPATPRDCPTNQI